MYNCLESLQKVLEHFSNYEITIIDNSKVSVNLGQIKEILLEVRLIKEKENHGFGGASNAGAKVASGKTLAFVNPDIELKGDIVKAMQYLESNHDIGVIGIRLI
ncbi:glycosyltransferase, partial [Caldisericum sp.]|uniref:glycosyltransferase n=1 Tax=Caldisericum sp. TaxID=2499687 RepID=UPI003D0A19A0